MENHIMIDIETTGVDKSKDAILEIGAVRINLCDDGYWRPCQVMNWETRGTNHDFFHMTLHYSGHPMDNFAKTHMSDIYALCNSTDPCEDYKRAAIRFKHWLHCKDSKPKFFMGWNASNFDVPFLFEKGIATPSYYVDTKEGQELRGDVHYRIYEQTGALHLACNATGLDRKQVQKIAEVSDPTGLKLPEGKEHNALYDCYWQIKMMNGLIWMMKNWPMKR